MYTITTFPYLLHFKQPAGTSRGVYTTRKVWYILLTSKEQPEKWGIGECAPLPDLSCDALPNYEQILANVCREVEVSGRVEKNTLRDYPSILFGLETALRQFETNSFALWDTTFSCGKAGIPINGLIWMSDYRSMLEQIKNKLDAGFRCIKLKIGTIQFEEELALLCHIRKHFSAKEVEIRVDANGAFNPDEALEKLKRLAELEIHSIEQPIKAGRWEEMGKLTNLSPLPIALDEELIGYNKPEEKQKLLDCIKPQYIILKPSLHGGITGCEEWIRETDKRQIGWWITSALESNIGLNAIAQWTASVTSNAAYKKQHDHLYQGLGTGGLFTNNIDMPLFIQKDELWFSTGKDQLSAHRDYFSFLGEWNNSSPFISVQTSGSTGEPKNMAVRKERMQHSALQTGSFLDLQKGNTALLCMPLQYIGAKMMVVRALIYNLNLIVRKASGHPLKDVKEAVHFAAMTPQQVFNSLHTPEEKKRLMQIEKLIIGGGAIDPSLEKELQKLPNEIYSTYGMTETLSHIALRRINGKDPSPYYTPFPSVKLSLSAEGTLVIEAPLLCDTPLITNDMAEINEEGLFRITGRIDNIINTGGIKVQAENIEEKLVSVILSPFVITSVADPKFGEAIVLLAEKDTDTDTKTIGQQITHLLPKHEFPKYIFCVKKIPLTGSGKVNRKACKEMAEALKACWHITF